MTEETIALEQLLGVEGLALLRGLAGTDSADSAAARRRSEIRELIRRSADADPGPAASDSDVRAGYAAWSARYDDPGNPIVELEQPIVWSMLDRLTPGRALDAACGTGRHTRQLADRGWTVTGVDLTPEMLDRARAAVREARFAIGELRQLPAADSSLELVVCGLALAHLPDPAPAIAEFARVLVPGGHAVISTLHPLQVHLGWHAQFTRADGSRGFVREYPHAHADYLRSFRDVGLEVLDCAEPALEAAHVRARRRLFAAVPEAALEAYVGLPAVLIWHLRAR